MELITDVTSLVRLVKSGDVTVYTGVARKASCFLITDGKRYEVVLIYSTSATAHTIIVRGVDEVPYWAAIKAIHKCGRLVHIGNLCSALDISDQNID